MAVRRCSLCSRTSRTHKISKVGICTTCDVALIYWRKKTSSQIVKRALQIESFQNRMTMLLGNVKRMPRKATRRRRAA